MLAHRRATPIPGTLEVLESGMLRPKKSLLAVFGLTRHVDRVRRLTRSRAVRELLVRRRASTGARRIARALVAAAVDADGSKPSAHGGRRLYAVEHEGAAALGASGCRSRRPTTERSTRCSATKARPARNMGRPLRFTIM